MRLRLRREPREIQPMRVDLGTLRLDHRVTHEHLPKPRPQDVTLRFYDQEHGMSYTAFAPSPGMTVQCPAYVWGGHPGHAPLEVQVIW
jgi:hypothetical protein